VCIGVLTYLWLTRVTFSLPRFCLNNKGRAMPLLRRGHWFCVRPCQLAQQRSSLGRRVCCPSRRLSPGAVNCSPKAMGFAKRCLSMRLTRAAKAGVWLMEATLDRSCLTEKRPALTRLLDQLPLWPPTRLTPRRQAGVGSASARLPAARFERIL